MSGESRECVVCRKKLLRNREDVVVCGERCRKVQLREAVRGGVREGLEPLARMVEVVGKTTEKAKIVAGRLAKP